MLRFKSLLALSVLVSQSALAAESKPTSFESEGHHYSYTTELRHGEAHIQGQVDDDGQQFSLAVDRYGRVSGEFGGMPVSYEVSNQERERLFKELGDSEVATLEDKAQ